MRTRQICGRHRAATTTGPAARHASPASGRTRRRSIVAVVTVGLLGGGVALAAWSTSGQGPGDAKALTPDVLEVKDDGTPTADLYPGATGDVVVHVRNPNPYRVELQKAVFSTVTASGGCPPNSVTPVQLEAAIPGSVTLSGNSEPYELVLDAAVVMAFAAPDACKGATFSVTVRIEGTQVA